MKTDKGAACNKTGFGVPHADACEKVAHQFDAIVLFREPGTMAAGLIAENYAMKGFRIDTKSCDWGPMSGFVCVDPRLTKDAVYHERNSGWTADALGGHIHKKFFGNVTDADWVGDQMPIVISETRRAWLVEKGKIAPRRDGDDWVGESTASKGDTVLAWRLVKTTHPRMGWLKDAGSEDHYVLCVNKSAPVPFVQQYPTGATLVRYNEHETILGLINPGTKDRGFRACVTADYDLFAIWPQAGPRDQMAARHKAMGLIQAGITGKTGASGQAKSLPGQSGSTAGLGQSLPSGVTRFADIDTRMNQPGAEHHRFGAVSSRVMLIKTMLNSALMAGTDGYKGGNAIHHNDESGNFALAKGTLKDCFPLIGFMPMASPHPKGGPVPTTFLIESLEDFKELVVYGRSVGFVEKLKNEWYGEAGLPTPSTPGAPVTVP